MPVLLKQLLLLATLLALTVGCKPEIGDECQLSTDCSAQADRLCDITAPGGYCTVFNCEPGACPEDESLCVQFGSQRSPVAACRDEQSSSPYARAFCMATCEDSSDCRDGYECADLTEPDNRWAAILIDRDRGDRACVVRVTAQAVVEPTSVPDGEQFGDVCHAEVPDGEPEPEPEPAAGGAGGNGAMPSEAGGGAGGASGAGSGAEPEAGGAGAAGG